jgi:hypothetical protein
VLSWNGFTGENTLDVGGTPIENVPSINGLEKIGVRVGDVLMLLRFQDTYMVLGRSVDPAAIDFTKDTALIRDFSGNIVFAPDVVSEQGIGRPFLGVPMQNAAFASPTTTVSATFEALFRGVYHWQHPKLRMKFVTNTGVGITGEARMTVNGTQVGSTVTIAAATLANQEIGPVALPAITGAHMDALTVELQVRRTAGASPVSVWMTGVTAEQS